MSADLKYDKEGVGVWAGGEGGAEDTGGTERGGDGATLFPPPPPTFSPSAPLSSPPPSICVVGVRGCGYGSNDKCNGSNGEMLKEEEGDGKDKDKNASETGKDPEEEEERGAESCRGCRERGQELRAEVGIGTGGGGERGGGGCRAGTRGFAGENALVGVLAAQVLLERTPWMHCCLPAYQLFSEFYVLYVCVCVDVCMYL